MYLCSLSWEMWDRTCTVCKHSWFGISGLKASVTPCAPRKEWLHKACQCAGCAKCESRDKCLEPASACYWGIFAVYFKHPRTVSTTKASQANAMCSTWEPVLWQDKNGTTWCQFQHGARTVWVSESSIRKYKQLPKSMALRSDVWGCQVTNSKPQQAGDPNVGKTKAGALGMTNSSASMYSTATCCFMVDSAADVFLKSFLPVVASDRRKNQLNDYCLLAYQININQFISHHIISVL